MPSESAMQAMAAGTPAKTNSRKAIIFHVNARRIDLKYAWPRRGSITFYNSLTRRGFT